MAMESTPDSGVEIRKEVTAPLLAPCFRSDTAAGSTPQDHKGTGTPRRDALNTDEKRPVPRCRTTVLGFKNVRINPPTNKPNSMYMDASNKRCRHSANTSEKKLIMLGYLLYPNNLQTLDLETAPGWRLKLLPGHCQCYEQWLP